MSSDTYEVYAVRYAHHERRASENFYGGDPHADSHDGRMPLDYFVWAIKGGNRTLIFDTGFDAAMAKKRGRDFLNPPRDGLLAIGVDPAAVEDVIISHMHYDHAGNNDLFPNANFHLRDSEMAFCTGRCMCHPDIRRSFEAADVTAMVERVFRGRVHFHDGAGEIVPGVTVHHVGGHTEGLQFVRLQPTDSIRGASRDPAASDRGGGSVGPGFRRECISQGTGRPAAPAIATSRSRPRSMSSSEPKAFM